MVLSKIRKLSNLLPVLLTVCLSIFFYSSWWQWSAMTRDWPNLCLVIQCGNVKRNIQENAWKVKYHGWVSDTLERTFPFENIMRTCVFLILGQKVHVVSPFVAMVDHNTIEFKNCKNGGLSKSKKFAAERVWKMCRFRWKKKRHLKVEQGVTFRVHSYSESQEEVKW